MGVTTKTKLLHESYSNLIIHFFFKVFPRQVLYRRHRQYQHHRVFQHQQRQVCQLRFRQGSKHLILSISWETRTKDGTFTFISVLSVSIFNVKH